MLEDERIRFDGISATSAGAMNATALAAGMAAGGHDGDWEFRTSLRDSGWERAEQWLDAHFDRLGVQSTVDLEAV